MSSDLERTDILQGFANLTGFDESRDTLAEMMPLLSRILAAIQLMRGVDVGGVEMALGFRLPDKERDRE